MFAVSVLGRRSLARGLIVLALVGGVARPSMAEDATASMHELADSGDFRVRVSAALVLGHTHAPGAREALEQALSDSHPAVRVAVARSLGELGDTSAIPALQQRLAVDSSASVTAQLRVAIAQLRHPRSSDRGGADATAQRLLPGVRYVVEIGMMHNRSNVGGDRGDQLERVLGETARAHARTMRGVAFVDGDGSLRQQAAERRVPIITLDGNLTRITESRVGGGTQVQVGVEFAVRRGQTLKGTLSGSATTFDPGSELSEDDHRKLEEDAVAAAVRSALRGAEEGLLVAAR